MLVSVVNRSTSSRRSRQNSGSSRPGFCFVLLFDMLEDHQVNRQGPQPRPDGQGGIRDTRRAGRDMDPAAGALRLVPVMLHPLRFISARPAARRCFRGGFSPGWSSTDGGIDEFPLFRDRVRCAAATPGSGPE
jgi:hypothetical protein